MSRLEKRKRFNVDLMSLGNDPDGGCSKVEG
jgi:hypothetical protein